MGTSCQGCRRTPSADWKGGSARTTRMLPVAGGSKMAVNGRSVRQADHAEILALQGFAYGGDERIRTADLLSAIQALSQLSYVPTTNPHTRRFAALEAPVHRSR